MPIEFPPRTTQFTVEDAQDAIGTILVDSSEIDFTYNDATPSITATLIDNSIAAARLTVTATARLLGRKTAGAGAGEELTLSEALDLIGSAAQGDILYRGASAWARLPAGTSGRFLKTNGAGADPVWDAAGGSSLPYMYPFSDAIDDPLNDDFREGDGAGGMDTSGTRSNPSTPTAWTAENTPTTTVVGDSRLWLTAAASASIQIRGYYAPLPSGNWCYRMNVGLRPHINDTGQKSVGIYLRESATGKIEFWSIGYSGGAALLWASKMTNATTHSAVRQTAALGNSLFPTFLEIEYDGTNYTLRAGWADQPLQRFGVNYTFAKNNFFTTEADGIGVFAQNDSSVATTLISRGFYRVPTSSVLA